MIAGTMTRVAFKRPHIVGDKISRRKNLISAIMRELSVMELLKSSTNIVALYGLAFDKTSPVLIVELANCPLDLYLSSARQKGCPISWIEKMRLCNDVCEGLLALHKAEIV